MDAIVGRSGNADDFFNVVTASALTLPDFTCGWAASAVANWKSTSPPSMAVIAGPPPLYGIWVRLAPANCLSISSDRWLVVPAPFDAAFKPFFCFLVSATSSLTDFAGTLGCSINTSGTEDIQLTGCSSFSGSSGIFLNRLTLTDKDAVVNSIV